MENDQDSVFLKNEGNRWFERNKEGLGRFDPQTDLPLKLIELYRLRPKSVLEVGASNGTRLAAIGDRLQTKLVAVEPSLKAIADGRNKFPKIMFLQGIAYDIPIKEKFELVIINFVFHWIDRKSLVRSVSELDERVADKGFLIIGDFLPSYSTRVDYHHLPEEEIYTYKQNYSDLFLSSGIYRQVAMLTGDHSSLGLKTETSERDRIGVWLLQKQLQAGYNLEKI